MDLIDTLVSAGGLHRAAPLIRRGLRLDALPKGVSLYRGWIRIDEIVSLDQVRAAVYNGRVTCCSAAHHYGLPLLAEDRDPRTHIAVPRNRGLHLSRSRRLDDVRVHRESGRTLEDHRRPWLAGIEAVLERACQCVSLRSAVAMLDSARFQGLCELSGLRIPERGPSVPLLRRALAASAPGCRSILETCARLQLSDAGIQARVGVDIPGVGEVDLVVFDRLVIEVDGWEFHNSREQRAKDLWRDRRLTAMGYLVARFDFDTVMLSSTFVDEVLALRERALDGRRAAG